MSLTAKMAIVVTMGLIVLLVVFGYLGISASNQSTQQTLRERVTLVETVANHLDFVFYNIEVYMTGITEDYSGEADQLAPHSTWLHLAYEQMKPWGTRVALLNKKGEIVQTESGTKSKGADLDFPETVIAQALSAIEFTITDPFLYSESRHVYVLASMPIYSQQNEFLGALVTEIDLMGPEIDNIWNPMTEITAGYMEIVNKKGQIVLSTSPERLLKQSDHEGAMSALIENGVALSGTCHGCHTGQNAEPLPEVMAFAPVSNAGWGVVLRQAQSAAFAPAMDLLYRVILFGLTTTLGAGLLVWITTRRIVGPITNLTDSAKMIARGNLATPIDSTGSGEIGILASTFDEMRIRLQNSISEIQAGNELLDRRVKERTTDLLQAQNEIQQSHDFLQSVIDGMKDKLVVVDRDFNVCLANEAVRVQWPDNTSLIGNPCYVVTRHANECLPPTCECPVRMVFESGRSAHVTHIHYGPNGESYFEDVIASPIIASDGVIHEVVELIRDVTDERNLANEVLRRNEALSALNEISTALSQSLNLTNLSNLALDKVIKMEHVQAAVISLAFDDNSDLTLFGYRGVTEEMAQSLTQSLILPDDTPFGQRNKDFSLHKAFKHKNDLELKSWFDIPLIANGQHFGSLCLKVADENMFGNKEENLMAAIGQQFAMAIENASLYKNLEQRDLRRGKLLEQVISAQEDERKRIARELHDDTIQRLTAVIMNCAALEKAAPTEHNVSKNQISQIRNTASQALKNLRRLIFDLRPEALDDLGLELAIRGHVTERLKDDGIQIAFDIDNLQPPLRPEVEIGIFRMIQESVSNILRHAQATQVEISILRSNRSVEIFVKDNGCGFDVGQVMRYDRHFGWGLHGISERAALLNGKISISSHPGEGTEIAIRIRLDG